MLILEGLAQSNVVSCIKHWPGDGTEERDQHLVLGVNELSVEEWEESFGKVYRNHIENGVIRLWRVILLCLNTKKL